MWNFEKNIPFTAHTSNPVYLIYVGNGLDGNYILRDGEGTIADVAPTILKQMEIPKPSSMTGNPFT
jgi:2,3-bisphosphoglycerate-independent phosphoglycerate mutase